MIPSQNNRITYTTRLEIPLGVEPSHNRVSSQFVTEKMLSLNAFHTASSSSPIVLDIDNDNNSPSPFMERGCPRSGRG